jgi:multidrug efflux pump subunit AcrA (membrane-fusion protein)
LRKGALAGAAACRHRNPGQVPGGSRRADNKVDIRPVTVGERIGSDWIISQGLQPGEQVIAEGTQKVRPGMTVNPKPFAPGASRRRAAAKPADKPAEPAPASKG